MNDCASHTEVPRKVVGEVYRRGLLRMRAGIYSHCGRILALRTVSDTELEGGLGVLEEAITAAQ